jgi:hypothetical protein
MKTLILSLLMLGACGRDARTPVPAINAPSISDLVHAYTCADGSPKITLGGSCFCIHDAGEAPCGSND